MRNIPNRRLGERKKLRLPATVVNGSGTVTKVVVVDMSSSGARLELPFDAEIEWVHKLNFDLKHPEETCELVWRDHANAGVRFLRADELEESPRKRHFAVPAKTPLAELKAKVSFKRR
ncbi:MAG: PilZ domain-containing protein [Beijerinckiaceae bacterium]